MVKQTRHIFDLRDILAVRLRCNHCGGEVSQTPAAMKVAMNCPLCHEEWASPDPNGYRDRNHDFVEVMKALLKQGDQPMTIRFEINGEDAP